MRIEGTYTLPATIDHVFAALLNPELLQRIIPGCERLIQLGPPRSDGGVAVELRAKGENGSTTLTLKTLALRRPDYVQVEIWGHAPGGTITGQASVDLVEQGTHTLGAYVLTLRTLGTSSTTSQRIISALCERLADHLYSERMEREVTTERREAQMRYQTPYGQIVALANRRPRGRLRSEGANPWTLRALWMGAGMLVGISIISLAIGLVRWLGDRED